MAVASIPFSRHGLMVKSCIVVLALSSAWCAPAQLGLRITSVARFDFVGGDHADPSQVAEGLSGITYLGNDQYLAVSDRHAVLHRLSIQLDPETGVVRTAAFRLPLRLRDARCEPFPESDRRGQRACRLRPETDWIRADVPQWRIVSDEEWDAAHRRLEQAAAVYIRSTDGKRWGRPPAGVEGKYLLSGLLRCACCGASLTVHHTSQRRQSYYVCASYHERGTAVCANGLRLPMLAADEAILTEVGDIVLDPEIVAGAIQDAIAELRPSRDTMDGKREALLADLRKLEEQLGRYVLAIAQAGEIDALVNALKTCELDRQRVRRELAALDGLARLSTFDVKGIERDLVSRLREWRRLLKRQTPMARQVLSRLLADKIAWTPRKDERLYEFAGRAKFDRILAGIVDTVGCESPYRYQISILSRERRF
jgi:hypothetical protein